MSLLAKKYLTTPATLAEQILSSAGDIVNKKHSCLAPDNVETLVFLKDNLSKYTNKQERKTVSDFTWDATFLCGLSCGIDRHRWDRCLSSAVWNQDGLVSSGWFGFIIHWLCSRSKLNARIKKILKNTICISSFIKVVFAVNQLFSVKELKGFVVCSVKV